MQKDLITEIMALRDASIDELVKKYSELFPGKKAPTNNKIFLWKQLAYKMQELEYGGLSTEAENRLKGLIQKYDLVAGISQKGGERNGAEKIAHYQCCHELSGGMRNQRHGFLES